MTAIRSNAPYELQDGKVQHFVFADALRATAILAVFICHLLLTMHLGQSQISEALGDWGVDAFFILSGFLLGRPYVDAVLGRRSLPNFGLYARRRFLRIWPAYTVVVVIGAALTHLRPDNGGHPSSMLDVVLHLLMLHNLFVQYILAAGNGPLWTMAVDAQFYLALPIVAYLLTRLPYNRAKHGPAVVTVTVVAAIIISLISRILFTTLSHDHSQRFVYVTQRGIVGMAFCFATGAYLGLLQATGRNISTRSAFFLVCAGIALLAAGCSSGGWLPETLNTFSPLLLDLLGTISVTLLIVGGISVRSLSFSRIINSKTVATLAENAYAFYLVHFLLMYGIAIFLRHHNARTGTLKFDLELLSITAITAVIAAYLLHRFVEAPFLTIKEKLREVAVA